MHSTSGYSSSVKTILLKSSSYTVMLFQDSKLISSIVSDLSLLVSFELFEESKVDLLAICMKSLK